MTVERIIPPVSKKLTKTMIEKGCPDCFKELAALARLLGVNFDEMQRGDKHELPLVFLDGTRTTIRFNVVAGRGGRKDKRYNIPAPVLKEQAQEGDTIAFTIDWDSDGNCILCVNVTRQPEMQHLTTNPILVRSADV